MGLRRTNLDLDNRRVLIIGTLEEVGGTLRYVEETKTKSSRRTLSLPSSLVGILKEHLALVPAAEFVFVGPEGGLLRRNNFRRRFWKPALAAAHLDEQLRFHDLRHTCASILIAAGGHPKEIQARLGHASIVTTMDRYGHLFPALGSQLDDRLDGEFGGAPG